MQLESDIESTPDLTDEARPPRSVPIPGDWIAEFTDAANLQSPISTSTDTDSPRIPPDWLPRDTRPASHLPLFEELPAVDEGLQLPQTVTGLEHTTSGLVQLAYTFVFVPKFPRYWLAGDIVLRLEEWLRHYSVAYHWRVNRVAVRPDHVLLSLTCPPTTAPERVARQLKRLTSEKVFEEFPRLVKDDPSGDFWAPAYLLLGGPNLPTPSANHRLHRPRPPHAGIGGVASAVRRIIAA